MSFVPVSRDGAVRPLPVDPDHPALTTDYVVCGRPPLPLPPPPPGHDSLVVDVNCFPIKTPETEYFKFSAINSPTERSYARRNEAPRAPKAFLKWLWLSIVNIVIQDHLPRDIRVVSDGNLMLYAPRQLGEWRKLTIPRVHVPSQGPGRNGGHFDVTVTLVQDVNIANLHQYVESRDAVDVRPPLQALDIVFGDAKRRSGCIVIGSAAYSTANPKEIRNTRLTREVLTGLHQRVHMGSRGALLVVDVIDSPFFRADAELTDIALHAAQIENVHDLANCRARWEDAVIGIDVYVTHLSNRCPQKVREVSTLDAVATTLQRDGRMLSVADYLHERYRVRLIWPHLPLVNVGSRERPTW